MRVFTTRRFERRLVKFIKNHPEASDKVRLAMEHLVANPTAPSLKVHRLFGSLVGCLACNISYGYRLIFTVDSESICFLDIGTHDDVYR